MNYESGPPYMYKVRGEDKRFRENMSILEKAQYPPIVA